MSTSPQEAITTLPSDDDVFVCPASPGQQALWFIDRVNPGQATYNIPAVFEVEGPIATDILQRAVDALVARHEVLRARFALVDGKPSMVVQDTVPLRVSAFAGPDGALSAAEAARIAQAEASRPFDLATAPLARIATIALAPTRHRLVVVVHHIISDAWSQIILIEELAALYRAFSDGSPNPLPPPALQYIDYSVWLEQRLTPALVERELAYWRQTLADAPDPPELPGDGPRTTNSTSRGGYFSFTLGEATTERLRQFCRSEGVTSFMVLVAAIDLLVARYTAAPEITIGTPVSGRSRPELEGVVGYLVNTIALRMPLDGDPSLRDMVARVRTASLSAFDHQDIPFSTVVEAVRPERSGTRQPLFSVMCVVLRATRTGLDLGSGPAREVAIHTGTAKFDWLWEFHEHDDVVDASLEFSLDLFSDGAAARAVAHFEALLEAALAHPETPVWSLDILTADERAQLHGWSETHSAWEPPATVLDGFDHQVTATAGADAVSDGGTTLRYRDLNARANRLANVIGASGVTAHDRVGILMDRSVDLLVSILAVLRAGAAYVPIDPTYPAERIRLMVEDAAPRLVLTSGETDGLDARTPRFCLRARRADVDRAPTTPPAVVVSADMPAYVMYTSGSTGRPKGVVMAHGALANLVEWQVRRSAPALTTLQFGSPSFDVSFQEIFSTWLSGGRLIVAPESVKRDPVALVELIEREQVARLFLPFVALEMLANAAVARQSVPTSLREVITAGEQLRISGDVRQLFEKMPACSLDNQYGPTETHVATAHTLSGRAAEWPKLPPIGQPIANARVHILDHVRNQVPVSVPGDLWIGGACLGMGYWEQPALTADRFPVLTIGGKKQRVYDTGDRGRWLPDGRIEFLGRRDDQVKIRGFRVEPGEVEAALQRVPGVRQAAVVSRIHAGAPQLVAVYVGTEPRVSGDDLRDALRRQLPDHLVPAVLVKVERLPMTPSGKVDRRRLPELIPEAGPGRPVEAPATATERAIAGIWEAVLGHAEIGMTSGFFEIGGHSLAALRVFSEIDRTLGVSLPLSALFGASTVRDLARVVDDARKPAAGDRRWPAIVPIMAAPGPPLVCVHSLSGDILEYRDLARHLGPSQHVLGIQATLDADLDAVYGSIEATAAHYLAALMQVQPNGPYYLCGWSSGGIVALEMAQQLVAANRQVALLAIIDTAPRVNFSVRRPFYQALPRLVANIPSWVRDDVMVAPRGDLLKRARQRLGLVGRRIRHPRSYDLDVRDVVSFPQRTGVWEEFVQRHFRAVNAYRARFYPGRVSLFRAPTHPLLWLHEPHLVWQRIAADLDIYMASGTHFSIGREPHVEVLAGAMHRALASAPSNSP